MSVYRTNEVLLAILAIFWGLVMWGPEDVFDGIVPYQYFNRFAPDHVWGAIFIVCGIILIIRRPSWARVNAHWLLCAVWFGIALLAFLTSFSPAALLITALSLVVGSIHATKYWRLSHQQVARLQ